MTAEHSALYALLLLQLATPSVPEPSEKLTSEVDVLNFIMAVGTHLANGSFQLIDSQGKPSEIFTWHAKEGVGVWHIYYDGYVFFANYSSIREAMNEFISKKLSGGAWPRS